MPVRMQRKKNGYTPVNPKQVCARGWQDYMLETQLFLGDAHVDACLQSLSTSQLERLGLTVLDLKSRRG